MLRTKRARGRTRLDQLFQEGAFKLRLPKTDHVNALEAILINTAGGLTGGDQMLLRIDAGANTTNVITTQACEKFYRSPQHASRVKIRISVEAGASLNWLPQESILFRGAYVDRDMDVRLALGAKIFMVESVLLGRKWKGEEYDCGVFRDRWRIHVANQLVHAETFSISLNDGETLTSPAVMRDNTAFSTLLLIGENVAEHLDIVRDVLKGVTTVAGGASVWRVNGVAKLLIRLIARDGYELRKALLPLVFLLSAKQPIPRIWST